MFTKSKFGKSENIFEDQENQEDRVNITNHAEFHSDVSQMESSLHLLSQSPVFNSITELTTKCQAYLFISR